MNVARAIDASGASKARLRLWLRLMKAYRMIEGDLRDRLRTEHGTTLPRFDVMAALRRHPEGLKMSALSGVLRVSNGNVTGIVDRLVADGLIERVAVEGDRRAMMVRLTRDGAAEFDDMALAHETWVDEMMAAVPPAEAEALIAGLGRITEGREDD